MDAGGLLALRIAFGSLSFVVMVILARQLGTEGLGIYTYSWAWAILLTVPAIFGMDQLLVREVTVYRVNRQWTLIHGILKTANWSVFGSSVLLALVGAGSAWMFRARWGREMTLTFGFAMAMAPLISLTRVRQSALQALQRMVLGAVPERLIQPSLFLVAIAAVVWKRRELTPSIAMALNVAAAFAAFLIGARWLQRALPAAVKSSTPEYHVTSWFRSSFSMLLFSSMAIVFSQADLLILGWLRGATAVGLYSVADRGAEMLTLIMAAQNAAFAPAAAALYEAREIQKLERAAGRVARLNFLTALPAVIAFVFFGYWILRYAYGPQFTEASSVLAILSLGQMANIAMGLNVLLLIMTGHETHAAKALGAGAAANIALNLLLIPAWGIEGAAIGNAASIIVWNALATWTLYRKTGIRSEVFAAGWR